MPNVEFDLSLLTVQAELQWSNLISRVLIKEIKVVDFFKREAEKTSIKHLQNSTS
jgi:hypothetical protein